MYSLRGLHSRAEHRRIVNNQGLGVCFCYKRLNLVINDSDFVILGFDLLIQSSDSRPGPEGPQGAEKRSQGAEKRKQGAEKRKQGQRTESVLWPQSTLFSLLRTPFSLLRTPVFLFSAPLFLFSAPLPPGSHHVQETRRPPGRDERIRLCPVAGQSPPTHFLCQSQPIGYGISGSDRQACCYVAMVSYRCREEKSGCGEEKSGCGEGETGCGEEETGCGEQKVYFGATVLLSSPHPVFSSPHPCFSLLRTPFPLLRTPPTRESSCPGDPKASWT